MNFPDEAYVRLYVRDTKTWLLLGFEGQCVLSLTMRKLDRRTGMLDDVADATSLALLIGGPLDFVAIGFERLLMTEVFTILDGTLVMTRFLDAQNCPMSSRLRQREYRTRASLRLAPLQNATESNAKLLGVTRSDAALLGVTRRYEAQRNVTNSARNVTSTSQNVSRAVSERSDPDLLPDPDQDLTQSTAAAPDPKDLTGIADGPESDGAAAAVLPVRYHRIPEGWIPNERTKVQAQELGFTIPEFKEALAYARNQFWERAFLDPDRHVQQLLIKWKRNAEARFARDQEQRRRPRDLAR